MAVQPIRMFAPTLLTTSPVTVYTVPTTPASNLLNRGMVRFTNTDSGAHLVTGYAIESGGSATATNTFAPGLSVPANGTLDIAVPVMVVGGFIQLKADANSVVNAESLDGLLFS